MAGVLKTAALVTAGGLALVVAAAAARGSIDLPPDRCIFCRIVRGEIPARVVFEDDVVLVFHDIHPAARLHILVVPKRHIMNVNALTADPGGVELAEHIARVAREQIQRLQAEQTPPDAGTPLLRPPEAAAAATPSFAVMYTRPPFTSISHLHAHAVSLPILSTVFRVLSPLLSLDANEVASTLRARAAL
ncbi:hypothetical protein HK405_012401 [Cladochytrium tenue]|nr:hypothetical protein HK405_012401 [Cladochytrium tenue]